MDTLTIFLAVITFLLGVITAVLSIAFHIGYEQLGRILTAVENHTPRIATLEAYREEHRTEVATYRENWRVEADRAWDAIKALSSRANGPG